MIITHQLRQPGRRLKPRPGSAARGPPSPRGPPRQPAALTPPRRPGRSPGLARPPPPARRRCDRRSRHPKQQHTQ